MTSVFLLQHVHATDDGSEDAKNATAYNHESEPGSWWEPEARRAL